MPECRVGHRLRLRLWAGPFQPDGVRPVADRRRIFGVEYSQTRKAPMETASNDRQ